MGDQWCFGQALENDPRMTRGDSQERHRWAFGPASVLFPVAQSMDADSESSCESGLGKPDESAQGRDICSALDPSSDEAMAHTGRKSPAERGARQFGELAHFRPRIAVSNLLVSCGLAVRAWFFLSSQSK